jgi:hypothetical protein
MDILRHGDSVVVTGDKALAALIAQRLRSAAARYPAPPATKLSPA